MLTIPEIRQKLESRLVYINKEIDAVKKVANDPILHHHCAGELQRMEGCFGEKQFLEKFLEELGDEEEQ